MTKAELENGNSENIAAEAAKEITNERANRLRKTGQPFWRATIGHKITLVGLMRRMH